MSYSGSTAGSTLANPMINVFSPMNKIVLNTGSTVNGAGAGMGAQIWIYTSTNSATEASSGTNSGTFFSDAYYLGAKGGDIVIIVGATGSTVGLTMGVLSNPTTAGAYVSTGSMISSTFS